MAIFFFGKTSRKGNQVCFVLKELLILSMGFIL